MRAVVYEVGQVKVVIPEGAEITLVYHGDEMPDLDMTPDVASFFDLASREPSDIDPAEFDYLGVIEVTGGIEFYRDAILVPQDEAIAIIKSKTLELFDSAVEQADLPDELLDELG